MRLTALGSSGARPLRVLVAVVQAGAGLKAAASDGTLAGITTVVCQAYGLASRAASPSQRSNTRLGGGGSAQTSFVAAVLSCRPKEPLVTAAEAGADGSKRISANKAKRRMSPCCMWCMLAPDLKIAKWR